MKAAVGAWDLAVKASGVGYMAGHAAVKGFCYWAMANPYEFISVVDVISQIGGPPDMLPVTPAGFVMWLYINSRDDY